MQSQFFISYRDENALNSKREADIYPFESAGIAKTSSGIIEGGVRHQFVETEDGFVAQLLVEFPNALPDLYLKYHQMHLACEFSHWIRYIASH